MQEEEAGNGQKWPWLDINALQYACSVKYIPCTGRRFLCQKCCCSHVWIKTCTLAGGDSHSVAVVLVDRNRVMSCAILQSALMKLFVCFQDSSAMCGALCTPVAAMFNQFNTGPIAMKEKTRYQVTVYTLRDPQECGCYAWISCSSCYHSEYQSKLMHMCWSTWIAFCEAIPGHDAWWPASDHYIDVVAPLSYYSGQLLDNITVWSRGRQFDAC